MNNKLLKSASIITLIAIFSKILGFGRELLMAAYYGASDLTDAFFIASIIPVLMFTAVGMAITTGMVPLYAEAKLKSKREASEVISVLSTLFLIGSLALTVIFYFLTPLITKLMAPGFTGEQHELTNLLTVIMLPSFFFFVLSAIMTGILEYEKNFAPPALISIPQNLFVILAIVFLTDQYGIYGIAVATLLGAISQAVVQFPFLRKYDVLKLSFNFGKYKETILSAFKLFLPIIIASLAYQLNAVVDRMVASDLAEGSVSALNYSNKLMFLPLSIILLSLITVIFPSIVDTAMNRGRDFIQIVFKGLNIITFVALPITIVMLIESQSLVDLAYKRGAFDDNAALMTANAFFFYSFGMVFIALKEFLNRCFVALKETRITMIGSVGSVLLNIILSIILSRYFQVGGIALATSIAMFLQTVMLFFFLPKKVNIEKKDFKSFFTEFAKLFVTFIIVFFIVDNVNEFYTHLNTILKLILSTLISSILVLIFAIVLRSKEIQWFTDLIKSKRRRQKDAEK